MKPYIKYILMIFIGLTIVGMIVLFKVDSPYIKETLMRAISDGSLLVGVLYIGSSVLVFVSKQEGFDGISYSVKFIFSKFSTEKMPAYYDYKQTKKRKEGPVLPMLICGIIFIVISIIFAFV